jgi:hypothetical protein
MISTIRSELSSLILAYDSSLKQWNDALNFENIPASILGNSYHISYQLTGAENLQIHRRLTISCQVRLFSMGNKNTIGLFDGAFDRAESLAQYITARTNYLAGWELANYDSINVDAIASSNDNKMVTTINLTVTKLTCKE